MGGTASWAGARGSGALAPPLLAPGEREGSGEGGAASHRGSREAPPCPQLPNGLLPQLHPPPPTPGSRASLCPCPPVRGLSQLPLADWPHPSLWVLRGLEPFKEHWAFTEDRLCVALRPGPCWGIGGFRPCTLQCPLTLPSRHSAGRGPGPRMPQHHTIQGRTGRGTGDSGIFFSGCREGVRGVLGGTQSPMAWGVASGSLRSCCEQTRRQENTRRHRETTLEI